MATLTKVKKADREKALIDAANAGARTLAGGLSLPVGKHKLLVADKEAFGILNVDSKASGKWALPIVAGTVTEANGNKTTFVLSEKPGAKTLVIPDQYFVAMQTNTEYEITIGLSTSGRKVVTAVVPAEVGETVEEED